MITKKQKEVFDFVKTRTEANAYAPSLEEIKKQFGFASVSTAHYHITKLKKSGFLKKQYYKARAISIAENRGLVKIPLVGVIAAGRPIEAIETPHESITIARSDLGASGSHYALRVQGDSMIGEGIFDGDIVVIRKEQTAQNGQTVVAIIDENEATLKKIYREKGRFRLQPANQSMLPIYRREVEVRGIVVRIIRTLENRSPHKMFPVERRTFLKHIKNSKLRSRNRDKSIMLSQKLLTLKEASHWASDFLERDVSESSISYLVQYGKVKKHNGGKSVFVDVTDLKNYYDSYHGQREISWKKRLGNDLNWALSFDHLREKDTTKHVHRLHPYKGKFIPQLVQYFIDNHADDFKRDVYFKTGDVILDPFSGSGTTLVQAIEMGMHSIGIDISHFNCMITETKLLPYDMALLEKEVDKIKEAITGYEADKISDFENDLLIKMADFNNRYFPSPEFKYKVQRGQIDENKYAAEKENEFLRIYNDLIKKYNVELNHSAGKTFLDKWYIRNVRKEIDFAFEQIKKIKYVKNKKVLAVILSRTIRSCRATTHSDLATLKEPQLTTYYCWKHKKICKPIFSMKSWFDRYAIDAVYRLKIFARLKQDSHYAVLPADSRTVDIFKEVEKRNKDFYEVLREQKIAGIFTSPPYVGQIDYHEQHAYAYDLFGFERRDKFEIGPLYKGQGAEARASYVDGISKVLLNCRKYMADNFDVFLVANDKYNLYPTIAERSGMSIVNQFKRPVLNRTERDKSPYSEIIFHLKPTK